MAKTPRSGENRGRRAADRRRAAEVPQAEVPQAEAPQTATPHVAETPRAASPAQVTADERAVTSVLAAADAREPGRPSRDAIARRAYELFVQRGGTHGYDIEDWLRAERELRGR